MDQAPELQVEHNTFYSYFRSVFIKEYHMYKLSDKTLQG